MLPKANKFIMQSLINYKYCTSFNENAFVHYPDGVISQFHDNVTMQPFVHFPKLYPTLSPETLAIRVNFFPLSKCQKTT